MLPPNAPLVEKVAARLKLSNKARKRIGLAAETDLGENCQALAYWIGTESAQDRLLLAGRTKEAVALRNWPVPRLPISGGQLIKRGVPQGPLVAKTLKAIERQWVTAGFPDGDAFRQIVAEAVEKA